MSLWVEFVAGFYLLFPLFFRVVSQKYLIYYAYLFIYLFIYLFVYLCSLFRSET